MVKIVEAEFNMEARELITAPPIAAKINPRNPPGIKFLIIKGKAASGSQNNHVLVYRSTNNYNWYLVSERYITGTSPYWIDFGYVSSQFRYLLIVVYNDAQGSSDDFYIDAVRVYS